jgi:hypothetical protein
MKEQGVKGGRVSRQDLNNPPTAVGGIQNAILSITITVIEYQVCVCVCVCVCTTMA